MYTLVEWRKTFPGWLESLVIERMLSAVPFFQTIGVVEFSGDTYEYNYRSGPRVANKVTVLNNTLWDRDDDVTPQRTRVAEGVANYFKQIETQGSIVRSSTRITNSRAQQVLEGTEDFGVDIVKNILQGRTIAVPRDPSNASQGPASTNVVIKGFQTYASANSDSVTETPTSGADKHRMDIATHFNKARKSMTRDDNVWCYVPRSIMYRFDEALDRSTRGSKGPELWGIEAVMFNDMPLIPMPDEVMPTFASGGETGLAGVWMTRNTNDGVHLIQKSDMTAVDLGLLQTRDAYAVRLNWDVGVAIKNPNLFRLVSGIDDAQSFGVTT